MLTLYEFLALPTQERYQYIWDKCVYLAHRMESQSIRVNLYNSTGKEEFWIEVWYNSERNELEDLKVFKARRFLEPYINQIKLDGLPPNVG